MIRRILAVVCALALSAAASAHDTWLAARKSTVARGDFARFDLTSGDAFATLDYAIAADRIARSGVRVGGKDLSFSSRSRKKNSLVLGRTIDRAGVAVAWVELKPRTLELEPDQIKEYLEEIGETETIGKELAARPPGRWREVYRKHAKTFVRAGEPSGADSSWGEPVGMALEIVPESDPTTLRAGGALPVRVLLDGRPLGEFPLAAIASGRQQRAIVRTDAEGRARVALDAFGPWLLAGTRLRKSASPKTDWESDFTTLTLFVAEALATDSGASHPAQLVPDQPFTGPPPPGERPYSAILAGREAGTSNADLLARVERENVRYSLTTPEIQKLRAAGVSQTVIEAMMKAGRTARAPTPR